MYCSRCGNSVPDNAIICQRCGNRLAPSGGPYKRKRVFSPNSMGYYILMAALTLIVVCAVAVILLVAFHVISISAPDIASGAAPARIEQTAYSDPPDLSPASLAAVSPVVSDDGEYVDGVSDEKRAIEAAF